MYYYGIIIPNKFILYGDSYFCIGEMRKTVSLHVFKYETRTIF